MEALRARLGGTLGLPSWGPGTPAPVLGAAGPIRSAHVCRKRCLWWGLRNMPNLCNRGKSSGLDVVSAATTATTFSKSLSCLYVVSAARSWLQPADPRAFRTSAK